MKISAIILTKNERVNILRCLKSLSFCDEIILIDDYSTDDTVALAEKYQVKVFFRKLNRDFSASRNWGLTKANGDWILFLDADEEVSPMLKEKLPQIIKQTDCNGFYIKRIDYLFKQYIKYGEVRDSHPLRLAKKNCGRWYGQVHENWNVIGKIGFLKEPVYHYSHLKISEFITDINFYSTIFAEEKYKHNIKSNLLKILFYPVAKLYNNLIFKFGILDGMPGIYLALMMSFHSFLTWSKLWIKQKQTV